MGAHPVQVRPPSSWAFKHDCRVEDTYNGPPCQHCTDRQERVHSRLDGSTWTTVDWLLPLVVITNNGDYEEAGACVVCLLDALESQDLNFLNILKHATRRG
jgi:hypothetical protein